MYASIHIKMLTVYIFKCTMLAVMDKLKNFLSGIPTSEREFFAVKVGKSWGHLRNVSYGLMLSSAELCIALERESKGLITCEYLRPDLDWHIVRGADAVK